VAEENHIMASRRLQIAFLAALAVGVGWVVLGSFGETAEPANTAVAAAIRARAEGATTAQGPAKSFVDLLPTTSYRNIETGEEFSLTEAFVIGEVTDATPGRFFYSQDDDESLPETTEVQSSDPRAAWATIHVTVRPTYWSSLADPTTPDEVTIGLAVGADNVDKFVDELKGFGTIAVPLHRSAVFSYDDQIFSAYIDGAFLATVGDNGGFEFPFRPDEAGDDIDLTGVTTGSVTSAGEQKRTVNIVQSGPFAVRTDDARTLEILRIDLDAILAEAEG